MKLMLTLLLVVACFGFVWADTYTECDYGGLNAHKGVIMGTFIAYNTAGAYFQDNGETTDKIQGTYFQLPLRLGFAFNDYWSAYFLFPLGRQTIKRLDVDDEGTDVENESVLGNGNPWLIGKWQRPTGSGFFMGPRLGFRFPILTKTAEDVTEDEIALGDKHFAIDIAAVGRSEPENRRFRLDTSVGVRYYMEATYNTGAGDYETQPGLMYYVTAEPGFAWGRDKSLGTYAILRYEGQGNTVTEGNDVAETSNYVFNIGLKQDWKIDQYNRLELRGTYDVAGKNAFQYFQIGLGYSGIAPTR